MANAAIRTSKLSKQYSKGDGYALKELSIQIEPGEVYGFLGANGAGKSTTIRLLMNFLEPSSGSASIMGLDSVNDSVKAKQHIGYLSGDVVLPLKPTGKELLDYLLDLQQSHDWAYRARLEKLFEAETGKPISALSKGNRQKIGIIQALMHKPDVLILDEPTSGLDPLMQEVFYDALREARDRGAAVFMSSHNLAEAQRVCDRVGIIKHGKLIREQAIEAASELGKPVFRVTLAKASDADKLTKAKSLKLVSVNHDILLLQPVNTIQSGLAELSKFDIRELSTEQLNLEDEFMEFYGDNA